MYIRVELQGTSSTVELCEGEDLTRLHVQVRGEPQPTLAGRAAVDRALRDRGFGRLDALPDHHGDDGFDVGVGRGGVEHAWLDVAALRTAARDRAAGWEADFDAMVDDARSKGWVDEHDRVRAHVVWSPSH